MWAFIYCVAFSPSLSTRASIRMSAGVAVADDAAARRLWCSAGKPLLRIGSKGAASSHANGLADLCSHHPFVCVKLTGSTPDTGLSQLLELVAAGPFTSATPVLLATRKGRRGGRDALFSQQSRVDEVCSSEFHDSARDAALASKLEDEKWAAIREMRAGSDADKKGGTLHMQQHSSFKQRAPTPIAMANSYDTLEEFEAAIREYLATLPDGAIDDPSLPSALNYNELNFNGRPDLVEGCMKFGGYLKVSNDLGVPVRVGVKRSGDEPTPAANVARKAVALFNMFGKAG